MVSMRVVLVLLAGGCYAATAPSGVPCDPATPSCPTGQACIAGATGFECLPEGTPPIVDAGPSDIMPVVKSCPTDSDLLVCVSFDAPMLGTSLANEGVIPFGAALANVSRIPVGTGGAGLFSATSEMAFPAHVALTGIVAFEVTLRLDAQIAPLTRVGIIDSDASSSGMSMFLFPGITTPHRIRCTIGGADVFAEVALTIGGWTTLACSCENGETVVRRDTVVLAKGMGCNPGSGEATGVQVGQNSRAGAMLPPNEQFIGAIDRVRLWTRVPP
jgi:hypothetical protein